MNVLVAGLGSAGDVHPNVALALELRRSGHTVLLIAPAVFRSLAERVDVPFMPLGSSEEFHAAMHDPDLWHPYRAFGVVARRLILPSMRPLYEVIAARSRSASTVVVAPGTAFGARVAAEKLGVPLATVHLQPAMLRSAYAPSVYGFPDILGALPPSLRRVFFRMADRFLIDPLLLEGTSAFRRELGLPPVRRLFDRWMHSPQLVLGLFPRWFAPPQADWPPNVRLTSFPLYDESDHREPPSGLEEFLDSGEPPLVFTGGSAMVQDGGFFRVSVEVCRRMGRRGLLLAQFPEQIPSPLPANVRHFSYVPFSRVLPRAAALVHHGGIGTTAQALRAAIPQLVVPLSHDQPDNAARVRRLGAGDFLPPGQYRPGRAIRLLANLLASDRVRETCQNLARDLSRENATERACRLIEQLAT